MDDASNLPGTVNPKLKERLNKLADIITFWGYRDHVALYTGRKEHEGFATTSPNYMGGYFKAEIIFLKAWRAATGEDLSEKIRYPLNFINFAYWTTKPDYLGGNKPRWSSYGDDMRATYKPNVVNTGTYS